MLTTRFDPFFSPFPSTRSVSRTRSIPIDVIRHDDHLEIVADLPGVDPAAVELTVENRVLTLAFERPVPEGSDFAVQGRPHEAKPKKVLISTSTAGELPAEGEAGEGEPSAN